MRELSSQELDLVSGGVLAASGGISLALYGRTSVSTTSHATGGFFFASATSSTTAKASGLLVASAAGSVAIA